MSPDPAGPPVSAPAEAAAREPVWGYGDLLIFFGLAAPVLLLGQLAALVAMRVVSPKAEPAAVVAVAGQSLGYLILCAALALLLRTQYGASFWPALGWKTFRMRTGWSVAAGLAVVLSLGVVSKAIQLPTEKNLVLEMIGGPGTFILMAAFGMTVAPLCEELAFRGFLQPVLVRSLGPTLGVLATALPFGFLHYAEYGNSWRHALLVAASGASFGWMRQATGSTRAAVYMHAAHNALPFLGVALERHYFGL